MTNRVAIVTAASRGMGAAIARALHAKGYHLGLLARGAEVLALARELDAVALQGSVTDINDLRKLVNAVMGTYGRIDVVVNNTGHPPKGKLLDLTEEDWKSGLDLVLLNVAKMAKLVVPIMQQQGGGCMINISTFAAFEPNPAFPVSSVMRAALASYAKLFADEYAVQNIRMNNVLPGYIDSYEVSDDILKAIPMGRRGSVNEIAKTVVFLASADAGYITGQNIKVDGGITRSV